MVYIIIQHVEHTVLYFLILNYCLLLFGSYTQTTKQLMRSVLNYQLVEMALLVGQTKER